MMGIPATPGGFGVILADPPWSFLTYGKKRTTPHRGTDEHYKTMTAKDLTDLPVGDTAAKDCALFMWVVDSHLDKAIELGKAWGFTFKSIAFVWLKRDPIDHRQMCFMQPVPKPAKIGMGYSTRKQAELCLLFTRGKPKRISKGVRQVIEAERREHSRKPDETFSRVEALFGGSYLELFARETRPGWQAWGNEVRKFGGCLK
ncbi:MAG: MT-A70 family methyltransferase [Beijerinckiaceae bacterium]